MTHKTPSSTGIAMPDVVGTIVGLKAQDCPGGGWTGQPESIERATVADCLAHGVCGCIYGDAAQLLDSQRLVIVHEADCTEAADDEAMRRGHEIERLRAVLVEIAQGTNDEWGADVALEAIGGSMEYDEASNTERRAVVARGKAGEKIWVWSDTGEPCRPFGEPPAPALKQSSRREQLLSDEVVSLKKELRKALGFLCEWAPDIFERHYMTAEQRRPIELLDEQKPPKYFEMAVLRRAALDALLPAPEQPND
jgi:hypothetical protein